MTDESRNGENENLKNEIVIFKNNLEVLTSKNASLEETLSSILKNQNNPEYQELLEENTILKTLNISLKETYEKEIESLNSNADQIVVPKLDNHVNGINMDAINRNVQLIKDSISFS
jgi:hypothetical protein